MRAVAFESEELRVFHKACREGRAADIAKLSILPKMLDALSPVTGRTVSITHRGVIVIDHVMQRSPLSWRQHILLPSLS